jgi:hypothetical protein
MCPSAGGREDEVFYLGGLVIGPPPHLVSERMRLCKRMEVN